MLSNNLTTNEVKNSAGTEVEFVRLSIGDHKTEFSASGEIPNAPNRLKISHQESGVGFNKRRRSMVRFDLTLQSTVDTTKFTTLSAYTVLDVPLGAFNSSTYFKTVLAQLMSFLASTGADTTIKYDCTGCGADALVNGTL